MTTTGPVTFVFTDIEGSTRLWEVDEAAMRAALEAHDDALGESFATGAVFKHTGDGMCAAFESPSAAIDAAATAQRRMAQVEWPTGEPIRIRVGIHTGEAAHRGDDYFGPSLNRTSRIMDSAHGGQVVVSSATRAVLGTLPEGLSLEDLGEHRFKDLGEPETVYQLAGDGLESEFPELRSLELVPNNLPSQLSSFIGRDSELKEIGELLTESRLVTLTGVGGVGKTRLAIQVAAERAERFPDGAWLVELAPLTDPELLVREITDALAVSEEATRPLIDVLVDHLSEREMLLVIDNCEHVIDEVAKLAEQLLQASPGLHILATSREGLAIGGERLWRVPSMQRRENADDALGLFAERARMVRPEFVVDDDNQAAVRKICDRLDGIPLAIELATARLKVFTPDQIAERLDDRFRLLTGGTRTATPRQRTLQATMDWSYDLLADHEQALLRRLSVFYGGFTFEAAEEVASGDTIPAFEILDLLTRLVESSLVIVDEDDRYSRYRLLETVRQYGLDRLVDEGEADDARRAHAEFFAGTVADIEPELLGSSGTEVANRLEADHDNYRAAITWALDSDNIDRAVQLCAGLGRFWFFRGYIREGADWLDRVMRAASEIDPTYADAKQWQGAFTLHRGEIPDARRHLEEAADLAERFDDSQLRAKAANLLGNIHITAGHYREALPHYQVAYENYRGDFRTIPLVNSGFSYVSMGDEASARRCVREIRDRTTTEGSEFDAWALTVDSWIEIRFGTAQSAAEAFGETLQASRRTEQRVLEAWAHVGLAEASRRAGELADAREHIEEARRLSREIGVGSTDFIGPPIAARIAMEEGDPERARQELALMLRISERSGMAGPAGAAAEVAAEIALAGGDAETFFRLLGFRNATREQTGETRLPYIQEHVNGLRAQAAGQVSDPDALEAEGAAMSLEAMRELIASV